MRAAILRRPELVGATLARPDAHAKILIEPWWK